MSSLPPLVFPEGYRKPRIGIVSKAAHSKGLVRALKEAGARVVPLGGDPRTVPPELDAVVVRIAACSHGGGYAARSWGAATGRPVIEVNGGSTTALKALRDADVLLDIPLLTALQNRTTPEGEVEAEAARLAQPPKEKPVPKPTSADLPLPFKGVLQAKPAPRLDSKGWLLRTDFPNHTAWVVAQIRANPAVANDWNAYTGACGRQRVKQSPSSWGGARTRLRKEGMAISAKPSGLTLEERAHKRISTLGALAEGFQAHVNQRAKIVDYLVATPSTGGQFVSETAKLFAAEGRLIQILLREVRGAQGEVARGTRSDASEAYRRKVAAYRFTPCEVLLVSKGLSLVEALLTADRLDGLGRILHMPGSPVAVPVPEPKAPTEPSEVPPEAVEPPEPDQLARSSHKTDRAWARLLIEMSDGDITAATFRELAAQEGHVLASGDTPYHKAVKTWRVSQGLPPLSEVRPKGMRGAKANWMPEPEKELPGVLAAPAKPNLIDGDGYARLADPGEEPAPLDMRPCRCGHSSLLHDRRAGRVPGQWGVRCLSPNGDLPGGGCSCTAWAPVDPATVTPVGDLMDEATHGLRDCPGCVRGQGIHLIDCPNGNGAERREAIEGVLSDLRTGRTAPKAAPDPWQVHEVVIRKRRIVVTRSMLLELLRGALGCAVPDDAVIQPGDEVIVSWTEQEGEPEPELFRPARTLHEWADAAATVVKAGEAAVFSEEIVSRLDALGHNTVPAVITRALNEDPRFDGSSGRGWVRSLR